jgi:hypothetical protein
VTAVLLFLYIESETMPEEIVAESSPVPVYVAHVAGWVYPIAAVVIRQLKLGEVEFQKVVHAYVAIDESKYNVADDSKRINPSLLMNQLSQKLKENIYEFQKRFPEFKSATFDVHFVMPGEVLNEF